MRGKTDFDTYEKLKACLSEIYPQIEVKLISQDPMLKNLGFVDYIPCEIELCGTEEQIGDLENMIIGFEIDAYSTHDDYPKPDNPLYIKHLKYDWIANLLYSFKRGDTFYNHK